MSFHDWMNACLYHPEHGYYMRARRKTGAGQDADFATSPTLHPFFGTAVGREILAHWQDAGKPSQLDVVEYGGGEGHLARHAQEYLATTEAEEAIHWHHVEISPYHAHLQRDTGTRAQVMPRDAFVVANEFLDALPFHWYLGDAEVHVTLDAQTSKFTLTTPTGDTDQERIESPGWAAWFDAIAGASGALIIDYMSPRPHVRGFKEHQIVDPLCEPGDADITANVPLGAIVKLGQSVGFDCQASTQEEWLIRHGALNHLNEIPRDSLEGAQAYLRLRQLILPTGLGAFKVLLLTK